MFFLFSQNFIIHEDNVLEYTDKNDATNGGGGLTNDDRPDKGGRRSCGNADNAMTDEGGRGVMADKGGREGLDSPIVGRHNW